MRWSILESRFVFPIDTAIPHAPRRTMALPLTKSYQICFGICNNGVNTHFGTEFSKECWCAENFDLTINGPEVDSAECDMTCAGTSDNELCGGREKMTAYEVRVPKDPSLCSKESSFKLFVDLPDWCNT